jgi:hypothetical protein
MTPVERPLSRAASKRFRTALPSSSTPTAFFLVLKPVAMAVAVAAESGERLLEAQVRTNAI